MPATLGDLTKTIFEHTPEAHKLHMEFVVAAGQTVHKGDPVILNTDGTVQLAGSAAVAHTIIGVSIHDGVAAGRVTIAMKAYCVVNAQAAASSQNAGPVQTGSWDGTTNLRNYAATADTTTMGNTVGHSLNAGVAQKDPIMVALLP